MVASTPSRPAPPAAPPAPPSPGALETRIAVLALAGIALHLALRWLPGVASWVADAPLWVVLAASAPLLWDLGRRMAARQFGSDLLAVLNALRAAMPGGDLTDFPQA